MDENRDGLQPENVPEDLPETIPDITPDIVPDIAPESELQSVPEGGQPPAGAYRGRRLQKENRWGKLWKEYGYIPVTIVVMLLLFKVIFQIAWVPSGSMETTLPTKSILLSWQLPYAVSDPTPQRGQIVTFWSDEMGKLLVKRVIGLPGDIVTFQDGYVYVNGEKLDE